VRNLHIPVTRVLSCVLEVLVTAVNINGGACNTHRKYEKYTQMYNLKI